MFLLQCASVYYISDTFFYFAVCRGIVVPVICRPLERLERMWYRSIHAMMLRDVTGCGRTNALSKLGKHFDGTVVAIHIYVLYM